MSIWIKLLVVLLTGVIYYSEINKFKICVKGTAAAGAFEAFFSLLASGLIMLLVIYS